MVTTCNSNITWVRQLGSMPLLSTPTLRLSSQQCPILTLSRRFLPKFLRNNPPHNLKVCSCRDEDCDGFLPWLQKKAGVEISSVLSIGRSKYGRSLFACKNIQAGDCLLRVPFGVQMSPDNLLPEIKPLIADKLGNIAELAVVILVEQRKAKDSEWAPYITHLQRLGDMHSTIFWSEQELEMIRQSSVYQETIEQQAQIKNDYFTLEPVLDLFPEFFKDITFENFRHAYGLVASRAWGSMKGLSLIPFADFLNHDGTSESNVLTDEDKQYSEVFADRNYVPGDEVFIRYGKFPNSTLLLDFGFTVPYNSYDQVCVQIGIPCEDHLRAMKLDLLQRHCLPKIHGASFSSVDGSFVIKKVRSSNGKGNGIPQSLRAIARVLCCNSSKELNELAVEASQHDGRLARRPLMNSSMEIQAHELLLSTINGLIDTYNVSIKSLHSPESPEKLAVRQLMAQDLLTGELQVLKSAAAWLENYCRSQGRQTVNCDVLMSS